MAIQTNFFRRLVTPVADRPSDQVGDSTIERVSVPEVRPVDDLPSLLISPDQEANDLKRSTKLRGGYYTPSLIGDFLAAWAVADGDCRVMEPSAGDGVLVQAAARRLTGRGHLTAIEVDPVEAARVVASSGDNTSVVRGDFFGWYQESRPDGEFDSVIGNPPFIRYQDFPEQFRIHAFALMREVGLHPSGLTNAWVPFVVMATRALRPGGRLALVLPAELLQVGYAAELRGYLVRELSELTVVTFQRLVFDGIQQETVLLLGIKNEGPPAKIAFVELNDERDLSSDAVRTAPLVDIDLDHLRDKWTKYYLSSREIGLLRDIEKCPSFGRLKDYAGVDVGVITGRNDFFVLSPSQADELGVRRFCVSLVGRSAQVPGLILREDDWRQLAAADTKCLLLQLGNVPRAELSVAAQSYVDFGETRHYHEGYKCSIRLPRWWNVPAVWTPDAFLLRQIHDAPRIISNRTIATSTDTIHRLKVAPGISPNWLAVASINSATFAFSEVKGRSYGGGVLELEPTEAEDLPFPRPGLADLGELMPRLDDVVRRLGVLAALDTVDQAVLGRAGFSSADILCLRCAWDKLSQRRRRRKSKARTV